MIQHDIILCEFLVHRTDRNLLPTLLYSLASQSLFLADFTMRRRGWLARHALTIISFDCGWEKQQSPLSLFNTCYYRSFPHLQAKAEAHVIQNNTWKQKNNDWELLQIKPVVLTIPPAVSWLMKPCMHAALIQPNQWVVATCVFCTSNTFWD